MEVAESVFAEAHASSSAVPAAEVVEVELVEASAIRRAPQGAETMPRPTARPRVSMDLDRWLSVDRQLHELYNLVEIAILQRDDAREAADDAATMQQVIATRLREWKTYARSLEERLHESQMENLELSCALKQSAQIAAEAIATPAFARGRKQQLRERLEALGDST